MLHRIYTMFWRSILKQNFMSFLCTQNHIYDVVVWQNSSDFEMDCFNPYIRNNFDIKRMGYLESFSIIPFLSEMTFCKYFRACACYFIMSVYCFVRTSRIATANSDAVAVKATAAVDVETAYVAVTPLMIKLSIQPMLQHTRCMCDKNMIYL